MKTLPPNTRRHPKTCLSVQERKTGGVTGICGVGVERIPKCPRIVFEFSPLRGECLCASRGQLAMRSVVRLFCQWKWERLFNQRQRIFEMSLQKSSDSFELLNDQLSFREKTLHILGHLQSRSITVKLYRCVLLCNNFSDVELAWLGVFKRHVEIFSYITTWHMCV